MKLQVFSDLHLETESFDPQPAPGAELLVLAGDIDSQWDGLARFGRWPVPVVFVPGNHEFDGRELDAARPALRQWCAQLGIRYLDAESWIVPDQAGQRVRILGTTRWCDFDAFGVDQRTRCMRAAGYFMKIMKATRGGRPFDPEAVRAEALQARAWLESQLKSPRAGWDRTVVVTHYAPSLQSADPRYGRQPGTASFCNADDDLIALADLWIHGHVHCRHDYAVEGARVVSQARGHGHKDEPLGLESGRLFEV